MASSVWIGFFGPVQISTDGTTVTFPNIAVTGQFFGPAADNTALPPYSFTGDTDTGYASSAANTLSLVAGGTTRLSITSTAVTSTVPVLGSEGTAAAPSFTFSTFGSDEGMWHPGDGIVGISTQGLGRFAFNGRNFQMGSDSIVGWSNTGDAALQTIDLALFRQAAGNLIQRNSTSAQRFDVANTYTSASNNELFSVDWQTSANVGLIGMRTAATGTGRVTVFGAQGTNAGAFMFGMVAAPIAVPRVSIGVSDLSGVANISSPGVTEMVRIADFTSTATSGTITPVTIRPTYNQSSGTAANTDLLINRTQTAVGSGVQNLIDAQVDGVSRFTVDTTGSAARTGANGQVFTNIKSLTELTTIAASPTTDTTIQMPANAVVLAVSVRTTVTIPTAATYTVGDSGSATRFSTAAVSTTANATDPGTKAGAYYNASALSVRITPNATPANNSGRVRVTLYYYSVTPATS